MISLIDRCSKRKSRRISMERGKGDSSLSDGWSICRWFVEMRMRAGRSHNRRAEAFASRARNDGSNERWSNERVQKEEERKKRRRAYSRLTQSHQREIYVLKFQGLIYECRGSKSLRGIAASIAPATNLFLFLAGYRVTPTHYPPLLSRGNNVLIQGDNGKVTVHSLFKSVNRWTGLGIPVRRGHVKYAYFLFFAYAPLYRSTRYARDKSRSLF